MKIAFLGPHASFTQLAATQLFPGEELLPQANILDCFNAVDTGEAEKAVVPLENSIEGTVSMTLDYLYKTPSIKIEAEGVMPIAHHLMIHPENHMEDIEKIYSHPQALAQSFHFLDTTYKEVGRQDFSSTAAAAKYVSENKDLKIAAVANQFAANLYGLQIVNRNIQDFEQNHTRFIVISKNQTKYENDHLEVLGEKSGMLINLPEDHAGGLHQVLSVFAWRKMNLSKIESRTLKTGLGNYFFFINVVGKWEDVLHGNAILELESINAGVDFLGNYKEFLLES
ncbi:prephenate dehydratase [Chryseobacterium carnipullorum]|uniref:Bifunctional chorismate mutase/prephenate dehydratase n=1 Tax=Chryseobacterium carnipullorum TaxID=1124835 RepID=A0A1M7JXT2_CHRCU|nr:prephenate dehydratase [Chryseobacterium carnipullorum]MDN5478849.1 prephenate dehydratase [Chryseobacterium sp.]AZA50799.1 prephenate dehydratase [Chryseobacterium carnipullorum]AZA65662.1 prephenate dehydratase [Chryseobacterium carnipullorum]SHM57755.1 prephenate dehydratase [Chryseobacterium carnipullorum]STD02128.1 P-protein [Chryseobacterium carnipullorum]